MTHDRTFAPICRLQVYTRVIILWFHLPLSSHRQEVGVHGSPEGNIEAFVFGDFFKAIFGHHNHPNVDFLPMGAEWTIKPQGNHSTTNWKIEV